MLESTLTILIPRSIASPADGERFLNLLIETFPQHVPERFGETEPLRNRFDANRMSGVLEHWGHSYFMADSQKLRLFVNFASPSRKPRHTSISFLGFQSDHDEAVENLHDFVCKISEVFEADFALAHILTRTELEERLRVKSKQQTSWPEPPAEEIVERLRKSIEIKGAAQVLWNLAIVGAASTAQLKKHVHDLYWVTVFGPPYVEMLGLERLLTSPGYMVRDLPYGGVSIRLTQNLMDTQESWDDFKKARLECKRHLDSNVFHDSSVPAKHIYRTPSFHFPAEMQQDGPSMFRKERDGPA